MYGPFMLRLDHLLISIINNNLNMSSAPELLNPARPRDPFLRMANTDSSLSMGLEASLQNAYNLKC